MHEKCFHAASRLGALDWPPRAQIGRELFLSEDTTWLDRKREQDPGRAAIIGTPDEVVQIVAGYRDVGVDELIVPDWTMGPVSRTKDTYDLFIERVASAVR